MVPLLDPVLAGFLAGFTLLVPVLWAPVLLAAGIRRLFAIGPTGTLPVNYALSVGGFALINALVVLLSVMLAGGSQGANLAVVFRTSLGATVGLVIGGWFLAALGLPRVGRWSPKGDGLDGRVALAGAAMWYLICTTGVFALLTFVIFAFSFPG